ncbi:MAG: glycoside hydrolase family 65 protein [Anaerolineae bacterium]
MGTWTIEVSRFDPEALPHRASVFTIGNGYVGTRGTFEEGYPGIEPVTLIHGVYDDVPIVHTELANAPDWLSLTILLDGQPFRLAEGEILGYRRKLDLQHGILSRTVRWRSPDGRTVDLGFERFASLDDPHVLALRCSLASVDYAGPVEIRGHISGVVDNSGYRHWTLVEQGQEGEGVSYLGVQTRSTGLKVVVASYLHPSALPSGAQTYEDCLWIPTTTMRGSLAPGEHITVDKIVAVYTSRDVKSPKSDAVQACQRAAAVGYDGLKDAHRAAWARTWQASDVVIEGDDEAQLAIRFSLFQLLIAVPRLDDRVSIPAKTLSGYGYRGHVFWDTEIFMLPFFVYTQPELARNMLLYRYRTLPGARRKAAQQGYRGTMYAWESAATGDETTPRWVPAWDHESGEEELVRIWCGDIELHITADVAYAVDQYWQVTGDDAFMRDYGAQILLETATFWASRAEWNDRRAAYEITDVIGPDENHEHVDNNAFTNVMARHNLRLGLRVLSWLQVQHPTKASEFIEQLSLTPTELDQWRSVADNLWVGFDEESGLIEQFEGFYELYPLDFAAYEPRETSLQALLGVEETQRYQVLKQPDVLMLLYLLGDVYGEDVLRANWSYYTPRTDLAYGSSLGPAIQAALAARLGDLAEALKHFRMAARTDLANARGNTAEGIHGATAGGLWQTVVFGFAGVRVGDDGLTVDPRLPDGWSRLAFTLQYRGETYAFDLTPDGGASTG